MCLKTEGHSFLWTLLVLLAICLLFLTASALAQEEARAVWFSRFEYNSESDIRSKIGRARSSGCNMVLFQIRGQGDAFYISELEPWSDRLGGSYPGFDPLAVAIDEARLQGMELHAYVNAFPAWSGSNPPSNPEHVYNAHPEWVMVDQNGAAMDPANGYAFLSPGIPQAAEHIHDVIMDIASNYDVDGIHLDYIRYPSSGYSYDDSSQARFFREYGGTPQELPDQWKQFRRNLVTQFVQGVYDSVTALKPWVKISAATWGIFYNGYTFYYQDSHGWLERGILDFSAPMIYTDDTSSFRDRLHDHAVNRYGRHVYSGIGIYYPGMTTGIMVDEIETCRDEGIEGQTLFSVSNLSSNYQSALLSGPYSEEAEIPIMSWKESRPFALSVARPIDGTRVDALFSQPIQQASAGDEANYSFDGGLSLAPGESALLDSLNPALVHLTTTPQTQGAVYTLTVTDVQSQEGQTLMPINARRKFVGRYHETEGIVVDNSDPEFTTVGTWNSGAYGTPYGSNYRWASYGTGAAAAWTPVLSEAGTYEVYAYWVEGSNRAPDAPFIVHHAEGADTFRVDQRKDGEQWNKLGSFTFDAGTGGSVTLTTEASAGVVIADAVKLVEIITAVPSVHFAAQEQDGQVILSWILAPQTRAVGCNLYRSNSLNGPFHRLNNRLLSGLPEGDYADPAVQAGASYFYLLGVAGNMGGEELYGPEAITLKGSPMADKFALAPNYPNPFNAITHIGYVVPGGDGPLATSLKIFNVTGQEIVTLIDEEKSPGQHTVLWNGRDKNGREVASGVYFCRLRVGANQQVRKMVLAR